MIRSPRSLLSKHGYSIESVKQWRTEQKEAGNPSTFDDFLLAHGFCVRCHAAGEFLWGILWQDSDGVEHRIELVKVGDLENGTASIVQRVGENAVRWEEIFATCEVCGGTGKAPK